MESFAKHLQTNIIVLKTFNAWIIGDKLSNPEKHVFQFKIPKNKNIDLSMYFNDVFPQEKTADTLIKHISMDSLKISRDSLK